MWYSFAGNGECEQYIGRLWGVQEYREINDTVSSAEAVEKGADCEEEDEMRREGKGPSQVTEELWVTFWCRHCLVMLNNRMLNVFKFAIRVCTFKLRRLLVDCLRAAVFFWSAPLLFFLSESTVTSCGKSVKGRSICPSRWLSSGRVRGKRWIRERRLRTD